MSHSDDFYNGARIEPETLDQRGLHNLEIGLYTARGRELQAVAVRQAVSGVAHALRKGLRRLTGLVVAPDIRGTGPAAG